MSQQITDTELRHEGVEVLRRDLGAVEALRFPALISRESFDYQSWRDEHFGQLDLDEIVERCQVGSIPDS